VFGGHQPALARYPHAPATPTGYHTARPDSRLFHTPHTTTRRTTSSNLNHTPHALRLSTTGSQHHERSYHTIDNGQSAPRALVPPQHNQHRHNERLHNEQIGTTQDTNQKALADHIIWLPNGMRISRRRGAQHEKTRK
jgi:hypothetical protein